MIFSSRVYQERRGRLAQGMPEGSVLVFPSWPEGIRPGWTNDFYRPSSDLIYFSGFEEPHCCLVLVKESGAGFKSLLFVREKDPVKEKWDGPLLGPEAAGSLYDLDMCYPVSGFPSVMAHLLKDKHCLYHRFGIHRMWDRFLVEAVERQSTRGRIKLPVCDPLSLTAPLRMVKTPEEIKWIRKSVDISAQAHRQVMQRAGPGESERSLHGRFLYEILSTGAEREAYTSIVASGANACTLHYIQNRSVLKKGDLLLVDAGGECGYYGSDITRTFPVGGRFSKDQKRVYVKLLKAQKTLIGGLKPGLSFQTLQKGAEKLLAQIMLEEGWLKGSLEKVIKKQEHKKYFPHRIGHSMGLDVHDPVFFEGQDLKLPKHFVLTIEPGLYLPPQDTSLKPAFRGMGLRIEDDVLVTAKGAEVLSHKAPKEVEEVEALTGTLFRRNG